MEEIMSAVIHYIVTSPEVPIGSANEYTEEQALEIFTPEQIMTETLTSLPYLVGLTINPYISPALADDLTGAGCNHLQVDLYVFNGRTTDDQDASGHRFLGYLIASAHISVFVAGATPFNVIMQFSGCDKSYHEAIPIIGKLAFLVQARTEQNVASSAIVEGIAKFLVFPEIAWEPASKEEIKDYAIKGIFAQRAVETSD
jgi:hypothetical protein